MGKQELRKKIFEWRETEFKIIERLIPFAITKEITTIIGPRRAGKTYFMYQIADTLAERFGKKNMVYIDFEDPLSNVTYTELVDLLEELIPDKGVLFLDEVQSIDDWSSWLRGLHNMGKFHIFVSGSSSRLLAQEIASELRGRSITRIVFPLSFKEFFDYEGGRRNKAKALLNRYLEWGGFPRVNQSSEKMELLSIYLDTIFFRDVVERFGIRDIEGARIFRNLIIRNLGNALSLSKAEKFFKSIGVRKSKRSLSEWLGYFEEAFLVFTIPRFSKSPRGITQMPKKVYPTDVGLFQPYSPLSQSITRRVESIVAINLYKQVLLNGGEIFYWQSQSGHEVDFLVRGQRGFEQLIQVSYDISDQKTRNREERSLIRASQELDCNDLQIITWDYEGLNKKNGSSIRYIPLWKWLLMPESP